MNEKSYQTRIEPVVTGIILILLGVFIFWRENRMTQMAGAGPHHVGSESLLIILVPSMIISGFVILVRGLIWRATAFSARSVFVCGLFMILVAALPWIYAGVGEGAGMLGTLLFITSGIPGIIMTFFGFLLGGGRKDEQNF